ncbi:MAG TPA: hypothetical protein VIV35_01905 [Chitinophagaceae bacterium]
MRKLFFTLLLALPLLLNAQLEKTLTKTIELKMPGKVYVSINTGNDSIPGTRGAAVVWHPVQKKYYAAFAGNYSFPLAVFDIKGNRLSGEEQTTLEDLRGLWYNPKLNKICGNGYSDIGWFSYTLDSKGIPAEREIYAAGMNQPGQQSIGVFNAKSNMVHFLYGQHIYTYNADAMLEEDSTIRLYPGISKTEDIDDIDDGSTLSEDYSSNVLIYTGIPKAEFGLLNVVQRQVELYNRKTGLLTQKLKLPDELPTWPAFNFSYANGTYWAFDQDTRIWTGYK